MRMNMNMNRGKNVERKSEPLLSHPKVSKKLINFRKINKRKKIVSKSTNRHIITYLARFEMTNYINVEDQKPENCKFSCFVID